ncbi:stage II sporulation protein M [Paenibacillus sambharensis]|uniref:Stage II sporulation protein M n=1 Tax=Paenibacillus sambharensis TaxID=1803190 RepID=A0A2W1LDU3_9BACL|nr:stage II sporulation protein M [Paenibacillus sambharensis]PZD96963.1 stage II sporulation protein M [Paenibacillus sambharensis]
MLSWKAMVQHLAAMRTYIVMSAILFFAGMIVGGTNTALHTYLDNQLQGISDIADQLNQTSNPMLSIFLFIFFNNTIKSIFVMYLGAAFGIVPLFFLLVNGMVMGYLYTSLNEEGHNAALVFMKGILPHGILEIPAIIIACAYGLKFGALGFRGLKSLFFGSRKTIGAEYEFFATRTVAVMLLLVITLLAAAIIETTVTPWLLSM